MKINWIRRVVCATLLVTGLQANESDRVQQNSDSLPHLYQDEHAENRVSLGDRKISTEEHLKTQERRYRLSQEKQQKQDEETLVESENEECVNHPKSLGDSDELVSKGWYSSHEGAFHRPISITIGGDLVTLEDGSVWKVRAKDKYKTLDWLAGDSIVILPNHSWFSSYYYVLLNQNTGEEVRVNLVLGPIYNGIYTHWIVAIDYYNQEVCLEDGSIWKISGSDYSTMKKWLATDTIIIGVNDSWFSNKPNILINVNTLSYGAAVCEN